MKKINFTRGKGLFEGFLAKKRSKIANSKIPSRLRSGKILDIGCGTYPYFLVNTDFSKKYGIDPSCYHNSFQDNIKLKKIDIEKDKQLPFADNFFNIVTLLAVFEHIEQYRLHSVISEINRVLKPEGRFILTTPAPWTDKLLRFLAKLNIVSKEEINDHKDAYSHKKIIDYLTSAGFSRKSINLGYFELYLNIWAYAEKR